jgi:hypothetical protein
MPRAIERSTQRACASAAESITARKCDRYLSQWELFLEFAERPLSAEEKQAKRDWEPKA